MNVIKPCIAFFLCCLIIACKNNKLSNSYLVKESNYLSYQNYKPNPDEVVVSAKLISYNAGIIEAEVVRQIKIGFSANIVLNLGDKISLLSNARPDGEVFICVFEVGDSMGNKTEYRISKFLK